MMADAEEMLDMYERGAIDRRQFLSALAAATVVPSALAHASTPSFSGRVINHVTLSVADVARSSAFYQGLLGATVINPPPDAKQPPQSADLRIGDSFIGLYPLGRPTRIDHFCVGIEHYDADKAMAHLRQHYTAFKPTVTNENGPGAKEVYLTDPDGIRLQLSAVDLKLRT